ncbi:MAG: ketopantoate reductase C-terminal domain-containing protein [Candidatus Aegiribacteria sp.]
MKRRKSNSSLAVWGDGAVGTGLAVALSPLYEVTLVGPPGSGRGRRELESTGAFPGTASVNKVESGDSFHARHCLVAVKAYHIPAVAGPAMRSSDGKCVCLSNGMGLEKEWGETWNERVEPAILTAGFGLTGGNRVETFPGRLTLSPGGEAESVFAGSVIPVVPTDSMEVMRWGKWLVNSVINPLGAITGLRNSELLHVGLGDAVEVLFSELIEVVPSEHRPAAGREALKMMRDLLSSSFNRCSMLQDLEAGRRTEIDFLTGLCRNLPRDECPAALCLTGLVGAMSARQ